MNLTARIEQLHAVKPDVYYLQSQSHRPLAIGCHRGWAAGSDSANQYRA